MFILHLAKKNQQMSDEMQKHLLNKGVTADLTYIRPIHWFCSTFYITTIFFFIEYRILVKITITLYHPYNHTENTWLIYAFISPYQCNMML